MSTKSVLSMSMLKPIKPSSNLEKESAQLVHSLISEGYLVTFQAGTMYWTIFVKLRHQHNGNEIIIKANEIEREVWKNGQLVKQGALL